MAPGFLGRNHFSFRRASRLFGRHENSRASENVQFSTLQVLPSTTTTHYIPLKRLIVNSKDFHTTTAIMGIKQLFSIIKDEAPDAVKEGEIKNQFGRKIAIVS